MEFIGGELYFLVNSQSFKQIVATLTKRVLRGLKYMSIEKTILIITDGIGHKENSRKNAFRDAKKPTFDYNSK